MKTAVPVFIFAATVLSILNSCAQQTKTEKKENIKAETKYMSNSVKTDTITFGGGCFWCTEAIFQRLKGVVSVQSGYSGGNISTPTYKEVCSGLTGHAECIQVAYDSNQISLPELLEVFFKTHDPTTLNRQGGDEGTQYRSVIFFRNDEQRKIAEEIKNGLNGSGAYDLPIVTEIAPFDVFYKAEDYHQNYFNENKTKNPYCEYVIVPKVEKFEKYFEEKLKK